MYKILYMTPANILYSVGKIILSENETLLSLSLSFFLFLLEIPYILPRYIETHNSETILTRVGYV